ncbi:MAG: L,D-transpeptidase [Pseudolabrys sp.]
MRIRRLAVALAAGFAALAFNAARAEILVHVDKAAQVMTVTIDGAQRYVWKVSTGIGDYDTPNGNFQAFRMERDHFSKEWDDAPMPYSIFFTQQGHAIHGSLEVKHLGRPASHGCVRLSKEHAAILYALVEAQGLKATHVVLTGEIPGSSAPVVARRAPQPNYDRAAQPSYDRPAQPSYDDGYVAPPRDQLRDVRVYRDYRNDPDYRDYREQPRYFYYRGQAYVYERDPPYAARRYGRGVYPDGW